MVLLGVVGLVFANLGSVWTVILSTASFLGVLLALKWVQENANWWLYETKLGAKQYCLPPGDMGLPFIGNIWSFLRAFKSGNPDSFINSFVSRFGKTGIYKAYMFGNPSIICTVPKTCKRVLTDDDAFKPGWPVSTVELMGRKSFVGISYEEHKRLRKLTAAPINGHEAFSVYMKYIEELVVSSLEKWSTMGEIEFLIHVRKLTFRIIMYIFLSSESEPVLEALERQYTTLNYGVRAMAINIPGFAYHKALKARKNLAVIFQSIVNERRAQKKAGNFLKKKKDMMDSLLEVEDEEGNKLTDEDIIDILVMYLNAGHESSGHTIMWATTYLQQHPEYFQKAKAEQEAILKRRPPTQNGLNLKEYREMEYLSHVIDETLCVVSFSSFVFREAKKDVNVNGYIIPKGWKVLTWFRSVHLDSGIYENPLEFKPDRWKNYTPKPATFMPFGAGSRLCPGNDLAQMEVGIFLHHFLLNYKLERVNPECPLRYLPHLRPKDNCLARVRKTTSEEIREASTEKDCSWYSITYKFSLQIICDKPQYFSFCSVSFELHLCPFVSKSGAYYLFGNHKF